MRILDKHIKLKNCILEPLKFTNPLLSMHISGSVNLNKKSTDAMVLSLAIMVKGTII